MPAKDVSIVVQGPFDAKIYCDNDYVNHYLKYVDNVVISYYTSDDTSAVDTSIKGLTLVKSDCPTFHCNPCNMYVQAFSTLRGLERVNTEFAIKIRANQFYTQIDKIIECIVQWPDKYIVCNINTLKVRIQSWKVSDHLFASRTKWLKQAMQQTLDWCHELNQSRDKHSHLDVGELYGHGQTEHAFFLGWMKHTGKPIDSFINLPRQDVVRVMRENIHIIDINQLKPFVRSYHLGDGPTIYETEWSYSECANSLEELGEDV